MTWQQKSIDTKIQYTAVIFFYQIKNVKQISV